MLIILDVLQICCQDSLRQDSMTDWDTVHTLFVNKHTTSHSYRQQMIWQCQYRVQSSLFVHKKQETNTIYYFQNCNLKIKWKCNTATLINIHLVGMFFTCVSEILTIGVFTIQLTSRDNIHVVSAKNISAASAHVECTEATSSNTNHAGVSQFETVT